MKRFSLLLVAFLIATEVLAQTPEKMSYQALVRDADNMLVKNNVIGMRISILKGTTAVYVETQTPMTNINGLASVEIGNGSVISGDFISIDWGDGNYFIKTETDPTGGINYTITGTSQILSVPYAMHSKTAAIANFANNGLPAGGTVGQILKINDNGLPVWAMPEGVVDIYEDGGDCIYLTPDASGGDEGKGFTCTGLFFKEFNGANPRFWVGNDGRNVEPSVAGSSSDFKASIVLLELDYSATGGNVLPATVYATKILEIKTENVRDVTVQGVIQANDGTLWFVSAGVVINIQSTPDSDGNAIEISRFSLSGANGLAYDDINNELFIKTNGNSEIVRYSTEGVLIDPNVIAVNSNIDQINFDSATNILYVGSGANGRAASFTSYDISTGSVVEGLGNLTNVLASEGVAIINHPDGNRYLYYASDAYFHQTGIAPDLAINAIHKIKLP